MAKVRLKMLVDSVQAAKFITDRKSRKLIRKLYGRLVYSDNDGEMYELYPG